MKKALSLAILSGGKNRRFGGIAKAFVKINGIPVFRRIMNCIDVKQYMIIINDPINKKELKDEPNIESFPDLITGKGPLSGIHSALMHSENEVVLIMPSDLPLMNKKAIDFFITNYKSDADIIAPYDSKHIHPVSAIFHKRQIEQLEEFLNTEDNYNLHNYLKHVKTHYIKLPEDSLIKQAFMNMNTIDDYQTILNLLNNEN